MIDLDALRRTIADLNEGWKDADAVASDMLRPPRQRELGPALAAANYTDARAKIVSALTALAAVAVESECGDPSGCGGAAEP